MINSISNTPSFMAKKVILKKPEVNDQLKQVRQALNNTNHFKVKNTPDGFTFEYEIPSEHIDTPQKEVNEIRTEKENSVRDEIKKVFDSDVTFEDFKGDEERQPLINIFKQDIAKL